ncbi:hypothetical protein Y695_04284 [Hydrogenophaga sp. T4]|nr:hypothetical protein Y695_04284 [Hydrogenophaga sp. T4]
MERMRSLLSSCRRESSRFMPCSFTASVSEPRMPSRKGSEIICALSLRSTTPMVCTSPLRRLAAPALTR